MLLIHKMAWACKFTCVLSLLFLAVCVSGDYTSNAENAFQVLQQWYNPINGLWNTCGWWNGANCMTAIADLASADQSVVKNVTGVFAMTYSQASVANPNVVLKVSSRGHVRTVYGHPSQKRNGSHEVSGSDFCDSCYDDNGWWALAWVSAYDVTEEKAYLTLAEQIFTNMTSGGPTKCNHGGIYWCSTSTYVNAIANELYLSVAAHLANRPTSNTDYYKSMAQSQWLWFKASGMINADNLINDGLSAACTNNGYPVWTYNQGVILGGLVELDKAAPNASYLSTAHTIAAAAIANLTDANMVLHETACEPNCDGNETQFKGIFVRNLVKLHQAAPKDLYRKFILANANSIWANDRNDRTGQLGLDWAGPVLDSENASTHSSALDSLVAAVVVQKQ